MCGKPELHWQGWCSTSMWQMMTKADTRVGLLLGLKSMLVVSSSKPMVSRKIVVLDKAISLKGKNLLPKGANSFLLKWTPFKRETKTMLTELPPLKVYQFPLKVFEFLTCLFQNLLHGLTSELFTICIEVLNLQVIGLALSCLSRYTHKYPLKYFLQSFSPFRWFKKGSYQFLAKECAQYWLTA